MPEKRKRFLKARVPCVKPVHKLKKKKKSGCECISYRVNNFLSILEMMYGRVTIDRAVENME